MTASIPLAWLGTYLIHSTLLLGAAWAASRWLRGRRSDGALALEESLWKGALVGGLLTATLQVGLGLTLATAPPPSLAGAAPGPAALTAPATPTEVLASEQASLEPVGRAAAPTPYPLLATPAALLPGWQRLALAVWLLGALVGAAWLAVSWIRLRRILRRRAEIADGPSRHLLDRLVTESRSTKPVRLTGSSRLPVPVALGVLEREICLPRRALESLGPRRQAGLLAHELAHLERRDPAWLLAARTVESLLFVQPLNRLARGRLQQLAELRCDAWAVERTGDRTALARCLTEVADWLTGRAAWPAPAWSQLPSMASGTEGLGLRVRRILEGSPEGVRSARSARRWSLGLPAVLLVAVAGFAPGVTPILPDAPAAEAATAQDHGGAADVETPQEADVAPEATATEESRPDRPVGADGADRIDRAEDLASQAAELTALHDELARAVEESVAEQQGALDELHRELAAEIAAAGDLETLSPEKRAELEAEIRRMSDEARRLAEHARPNREELERLQEEALRLSRESASSPEAIERANREIERMNREVERMSREVEGIDQGALRQIEQEVRRRAAEIDREVERAERRAHDEATERHSASLEVQRQELEERMHVLEERRQELETRFQAEQEALERAMEARRQELDARRQELDARRQELEERRRALEQEAEARERAAAESAEGAESEAAPEPPRR